MVTSEYSILFHLNIMGEKLRFIVFSHFCFFLGGAGAEGIANNFWMEGLLVHVIHLLTA